MLKGDLATTPLAEVLTSLADAEATGCLHIEDEATDEALVYLKRGLVYSAYVPGRRPQLGARLISSGALAPEALEEALEAQATELQGWRLGELLVHLGYVERGVIEAFVLEQLRESTFDLAGWQQGRWKFRKNEKTREDVGSSAPVADLLAEVERRGREWQVINNAVHGPDAVPALSAGGLAAAEMTLDQDQWALLCKVDGVRTISQLARDCGFTDFEAGQIVYALVTTGLLEVEEVIGDALPDDDDDEAPTGLAAVASSLLAVFSASEGTDTDDDAAAAEPTAQLIDSDGYPIDSNDDGDLAARISSALFVPLVPEPNGSPTPVEAALDAALAAVAAEEPALDDWSGSLPDDAGDSELARLLGDTDAVTPVASEDPFISELASLTAALEVDMALPSLNMPATLEPDYPQLPTLNDVAPETLPIEELTELAEAAEVGEVVELPDVADESTVEILEEATAEILGETAPDPVEALPDTVRLAPSPSDISLPDAAHEAGDTFTDSLAKVSEALNALLGDALPTVAPAAPPPAEAIDEEALRHAQQEAERAERVRIAAAAELAEAHAAAEAERGKSGRKTKKAEAARRAAEEAEQLAAEQAAAAAVAAEEAAQLAADEAARVAAEQAEAERVAAEQAEAERVAAEQAEAERVAAEQAEAERVAAEQAEAERVAAEEAERLAAEQAEAERLAAEAEAERLAVEEAARAAEEAERFAAEQADAERRANEAAERVAAEEAEAGRLAAEEAERAEIAVAARAAAEEVARLTAEAEAEAPVEGSDDTDGGDDDLVTVLDELGDAELEELTALDEDAEVSALLRDMTHEAAAEEPESAPDEPEPAPEPARLMRPGMNETAALLRELSSLGFDDDEGSGGGGMSQKTATRQAAPAKDAKKKRKGIFGLG